MLNNEWSKALRLFFVDFGLLGLLSVSYETGQLGSAFKVDAIHVSAQFTSFFSSTVGKKIPLERQIGVGDQRAESGGIRLFAWKSGTSNPGGIMGAGESFLSGPPFQFVFKDFGCVAQTIKRFSFLYGDCPDAFFHQSPKK